jgi:hypothetical protein
LHILDPKELATLHQCLRSLVRVESKQAKKETGECQLNEAFHFFCGSIQERVPNLACTVTCPSSQKPCIIKLICSSASRDIETPFVTLKKKVMCSHISLMDRPANGSGPTEPAMEQNLDKKFPGHLPLHLWIDSLAMNRV